MGWLAGWPAGRWPPLGRLSNGAHNHSFSRSKLVHSSCSASLMSDTQGRQLSGRRNRCEFGQKQSSAISNFARCSFSFSSSSSCNVAKTLGPSRAAGRKQRATGQRHWPAGEEAQKIGERSESESSSLAPQWHFQLLLGKPPASC